MRKVKIISLEGMGEVTIKEVSPMALYLALKADNRIDAMLAIADDCVSLGRDKIENLYASEMEQLIDAVKEVNSSFLGVADKLGVAEPLQKMAKEFVETLPPLFVGLFRQGMATPGTTAGSAS